MERTAILGRLTWQIAEVEETIQETPRVHTISLRVPGWEGHLPGQHVDVRLTAEDGYQAQRSYSIASAPEDRSVKLTVERIDDGEVSPYLVDELRAGDQIELRGPIGGYFVWNPQEVPPVLLVAGGSGIVPLMAMARHNATLESPRMMRLLFSSRTIDDVIYRAELDTLSKRGAVEVTHTLTRAQPVGWTGFSRRVNREMLSEVAWPPADSPAAFICGPTPFVESVATFLTEIGYDASRVKTERFGPSGR